MSSKQRTKRDRGETKDSIHNKQNVELIEQELTVKKQEIDLVKQQFVNAKQNFHRINNWLQQSSKRHQQTLYEAYYAKYQSHPSYTKQYNEQQLQVFAKKAAANKWHQEFADLQKKLNNAHNAMHSMSNKAEILNAELQQIYFKKQNAEKEQLALDRPRKRVKYNNDKNSNNNSSLKECDDEENKINELKIKNGKLLDGMNQLFQEKIKLQSDIINERLKYDDKIDGLQKQIDHLKRKMDIYEGTKNTLNTFELDELNNLESKLFDGIKNIQCARNKLMENRFKCIICLDNQKNISFDGCNHLVLCQECEKKMEQKKCPICRKSYNNIKEIKL